MRWFVIWVGILFSVSAQGALKEHQRQELESVNLLSNGGIEHGLTEWTASAGSLSTDTSTPLYGNRSLTWDAAADGDTLDSDAVTLTDGFDGQQCMARIYYQYLSGNDGDYELKIYDGSADLVSVGLNVTTKTEEAFVTAPCPDSGSIRLRVEATADGGLLECDRAHLGTDVHRISQGQLITSWAAYTPTISGFGTTSGEDCFWKRVGDSMDIKCEFTAGTVAASEAQIGLPDGRSVDSTVAGNTVVGVYGRDTSTADSGGLVLATAGDTFVNLGHARTWSDTATVARTPTDGNNILGNSQSLGLHVTGLKIEGWASSTTSIAFDQADRNGSLEYAGTTNCNWTTTSATFAAFAADLNCPSPTLKGGSVSAPGTKIPGVVASNIRAGDTLLVIAQGSFRNEGAGDTCEFQLSDGTNTSGTVYSFDPDAFGGADATLIGVFTYASAATSKTIQVFGKRSSGSAGNCSINAAVTDRDFTITVVRLNELKGGITFENMVASSATDGMKTCSGRITNSGTPLIASDEGNCVDSLTHVGTGGVRVNFVSGLFSSAPHCVVSVEAGSNHTGHINTAPTTTTLQVHTGANITDTATDENFMFVCIGES